MKNYVIGIDLGGTKISTAISDLNGNVLNMYTKETEAKLGENKVIENIILTINTVLNNSNTTLIDIACIGIGCPGPLDIKAGTIISSPNLPFDNFEIIKELKKSFDIDFYLDNDANVATIGEYVLGAAKGFDNIVYVTVSTGVGGGAIINGELYRGSTSNALEVGHMTLDPLGPVCGCGNTGCLEAFSSGTAIAKKANDLLKTDVITSLRNYETVTSFEVFKEYKNNDAISIKIIDTALTYLGVGIANIITTFDPSMVIIGGGVSNAGDILFDKVRNIVKERNFKVMSDNCKIVKAGLGTDAGVLGAVSLAILEYRKKDI